GSSSRTRHSTNALGRTIGPRCLEFGHKQPLIRAKEPEENFLTDAFHADRTLRRKVRDHCANRASARIILSLFFSGQEGANKKPAKRAGNKYSFGAWQSINAALVWPIASNETVFHQLSFDRSH